MGAAIAIPVLRATARDIKITHHFTAKPSTSTRSATRATGIAARTASATPWSACQSLLKPGQTVIEVGGHIGYLSTFFASLVGETGQVHVFEPGDNNLPYLRKNIVPYRQISIVEKAVGSVPGRATFYVEDLTGQNNSMVPDNTIFKENAAAAFDQKSEFSERSVEVIRLDDYAAGLGRPVDFMKIDVEGFELSCAGHAQVLDIGADPSASRCPGGSSPPSSSPDRRRLRPVR